MAIHPLSLPNTTDSAERENDLSVTEWDLNPESDERFPSSPGTQGPSISSQPDQEKNGQLPCHLDRDCKTCSELVKVLPDGTKEEVVIAIRKASKRTLDFYPESTLPISTACALNACPAAISKLLKVYKKEYPHGNCEKDEDDWLPIHWAACFSKLNVLEALLEDGEDEAVSADSKTPNGKGSLGVACNSR